MNTAGRLARIAFGLLLGLAVTELGLRLALPLLDFERLPFSYEPFARDPSGMTRGLLTYDSYTGWLPTPGADMRGANRVRYRHDKQGLRAEHVYSPTPAPGVRRISAYGDSFTYCIEVDLSDCWTAGLEERLPAAEVLNYGVISYGPDQAWLRYQQAGAEREPCAVLIGFLIDDLARVVNRFRPFYHPGAGALAKPRFLLKDDGLQLLPIPASQPQVFNDPAWVEANLGPHDAMYFPGTFVPNPFDVLETGRLVRTAAYRYKHQQYDDFSKVREPLFQPGTEALEVSVEVLSAFADEVRSDGATPVIVIFPWKPEVIRQRDGLPKVHEPLLQALRQRGTALIDLTDSLGEVAKRLRVAAMFDNHFTPPANAAVARTLASRLPPLTAATCGDWRTEVAQRVEENDDWRQDDGDGGRDGD